MAQQERDVSEVRPVGGIEALVDLYHQIRFSETQQRQLRWVEIQLLFKVSRHGEALLHMVHGVSEQALIDSLFSRNDALPRFEPRMENGFAEPSYFALGLSFPDGFRRIPESNIAFSKFGIGTSTDDLEIVELRRPFMSHAGASGNVFTGAYSDHFAPGYGIFLEMAHYRKTKPHGYVLQIGIFMNNITKPLPIATERNLMNRKSSVFGDLGYAFLKGNNVFTPSLSIMGSTIPSLEEEEEGIQENRYGIGFAYTRRIPFFKERIIYNDVGPSLHQQGISVSLRSTYYFAGSDVLGRGVMFSLFIGYFSRSQRINEYRFKDSFYE